MSSRPFEEAPIDERSQLIWENRRNFTVDLSKDGKSVELWIGDASFLPIDVFFAIFTVASHMASDKKDGTKIKPSAAILIFYETTAGILGYISMINTVASLNSIQKEDYSIEILRYNTFVDWAVAELDVELKNGQVIANRSAIENNRLSGITNKLIAVFTGAAAIWYLRDTVKSILLNYFAILDDTTKAYKLNHCATFMLDLLTIIAFGVGIKAFRDIFQTKEPEEMQEES